MTKYQDWMSKQDPEFIREVHKNGVIPIQFKDDRRDEEISLEQLAELDNKYINPEG